MTTNGMTTNNQAPGLDLRALTTLIFDLDGVIWRGSEPIEGAAASVARLRQAGKRCLYCTNNSKATQKQFADKLRAMGIELEEEDVISSSIATAMYLSAQFTGPFLVYVIGEEGIVAALQKIGAHVVADNDYTDETEVDCVVVGIDRNFSYDKLRIAQRLIHKGALFIATNRDNTFPTENGIVPGAGSIVSSVEAASGVAPVTIGKPRPAMVHLVMSKLGAAPHEVAMIGDRLDTDIACARRAGIAGLFVATGVTPMQQARKAKGELRANAFFEDLPALCDAILSDTPHVDEPIAVQAATVAQGTSSGLQNATDAQPETAPLEFAPLEAQSDLSTPVAETMPAAGEFIADEIGPMTDVSADIPIDKAIGDETLVWDAEPADITPALDDAATPGIAEVADIAEPLTAETPADDVTGAPSDAVENWDDSWFAADNEPADDSEPATVDATAASAAAAEPFDLDFDLSTPASPSIADTGASSASGAEGEIIDATSPRATQQSEATRTKNDGFDWKLD